MDRSPAVATDVATLQPELDRIAALQSKAELGAYLGHAQSTGNGAFFNFGRIQDPQNAGRTIAVLSQGGMGLPDRDAYLRSTPDAVEIRRRYVDQIAKMLALTGVPPAKAGMDAAAILKLETALARVSLDATSLHDPKISYHFMPAGDLKKLAPAINWDAFVSANGIAAFAHLNIAGPDFLVGLNTVLEHEDMATIRAYLRWQLRCPR
jgi:predicted metalloendopeptidase